MTHHPHAISPESPPQFRENAKTWVWSPYFQKWASIAGPLAIFSDDTHWTFSHERPTHDPSATPAQPREKADDKIVPLRDCWACLTPAVYGSLCEHCGAKNPWGQQPDEPDSQFSARETRTTRPAPSAKLREAVHWKSLAHALCSELEFISGYEIDRYAAANMKEGAAKAVADFRRKVTTPLLATSGTPDMRGERLAELLKPIIGKATNDDGADPNSWWIELSADEYREFKHLLP